MTVIATASNPRFSVSRVDIDRGGPTYTSDTLRDLQALNPDADLYFITGADALASILSWQDWEEMFALARFVGVSRPGYELDGKHIAAALKNCHADALTLVEVPALAISSTDCRKRAEESRPIWYLVPDGVVQYVSKRRFYRPASPCDDRSSRGDRLRRSHHDGDGRRAARPPPNSPTTSSSSTCPAARHHRLLRDRIGDQRASGQRHRRRGRGEDALGRLQAGTARRRPRRPLDTAGLRRHRRAHPASGRAQFLCAGPAMARLPGHSGRPGRRDSP